MVRGDRFLAEPLAEMARGALGHAPRVDEDQRRPVQQDQLGDAAVDLLPLVVRHHRRRAASAAARGRGRAAWRSRCRRSRNRRRPSTTAPAPTRKRATSSIGFCVADRPMRTSGRGDDRLQPLERQREVAAALARRDGVDLVDDDGAHGRQHRSPRDRAEQDVQRFGRRHQDVRRLPQALAPLGGRRVAGAHGGADLDVGQAERAQLGADAGERRLEVGADVVRERLQRRDVDDASSRRRGRPARGRRAPGASSAARKAVSVLPEPVGAATSVCRPARIAGQAARLRFGRRGERRAEPAGDGGMEVLRAARTKQKEGRAARDGDGAQEARTRPVSDRPATAAFQVGAGDHSGALTLAPPARRPRPGCRDAAAPRRRSRSPWPLDERRERLRGGLAAGCAGTPIACSITMKRPGRRRTPPTRAASASSCCLTPAATSAFWARNSSTTFGEVGVAQQLGRLQRAASGRGRRRCRGRR